MCVLCVSVVTAASLLSPVVPSSPPIEKNIVSYEFTNKACSKSNLNKVVDNKICLKNGKVYRWAIKKESKVPVITPIPIPVPKTTPVPTPTPTPTQKPDLIEKGLNVDLCKMKEVSNARGMTGAGFPLWNSLTPRVGTVKWALIPIDFPDLAGEKNFRSRVDQQMSLLSEWESTVSEGKFKVEWVVAKDWVRMQAPTSEYAIPFSVNVNNAANGPKLFRDAMSAADPVFDFTNIQTVNFILPSGQIFLGETSQGFPWDQTVKEYITKEGPISSYTIAGKFMDAPTRTYWSYWAHEFGHAIGLPHIGSSHTPNPFHGLDLMGSQDGPSRELSGWLRFFAGWMPDEKVYCQDATSIKPTSLTLVPLSGSIPGLKMAIIKVSETKQIIIESRRVTKFSCSTSQARNGVLVYTYDAMLGHGQEFLKPFEPAGRPLEGNSCGTVWDRDVILRPSDSITVEGIKITVISSGTSDYIKIEK